MKYGPLCLAIAAALSVLRAAPQAAQPGDYKLLTESTREEIVAELPELSAMQFDSNQDRLDPILASAGDNLDAMFSKLPNLAATEQIHEMRFQDGAHTARQETFGYRLQVHGDASPPSFEELRLDAATGDPAPAP